MRKNLVGLSALFAVLIVALIAGLRITESQAAVGPALSMTLQLPALPNSTVVMPVQYAANSNAIASVVFSIDFDQNWLSVDPTDNNQDGIPDAIKLILPAAFGGSSCYFDITDTDGEIDCFIIDISVPLATLPSGKIMEIQFQTGNTTNSVDAVVAFSQNSPPASFGSTTGQSVAGTTQNGSVLINSSPMNKRAFLPFIPNQPSPTPSPTATPTKTPTFTSTPTKTNTPPVPYKPTATQTPTKSLTPTVTPTKTQVPCSNLIKNGGFESTSDWQIPVTEYTAGYSTVRARSGTRSMRTGITYSGDNRYSYSSARQLITIPFGATKARLTFYYFPSTTESPLLPVVFQPKVFANWYAPTMYDTQYVVVTNANDVYLETIFAIRSNAQNWTQQILDLLFYSGKSIKIEFGTYNDGYGGYTSMYVDDVSFEYCP